MNYYRGSDLLPVVFLVPQGPLGSEERTGNIAKRRLLVNPYVPEIQTGFCSFSRGSDLNSEKGGIYESAPDRYVPISSGKRNKAHQPFLGPTML